MTEDDLLRDSYTHLREVIREWCDSKDYPQPGEFFFAAPVVKNSSLDASEGGVFFDKPRMVRLLREAGFTKARVPHRLRELGWTTLRQAEQIRSVIFHHHT